MIKQKNWKTLVSWIAPSKAHDKFQSKQGEVHKVKDWDSGKEKLCLPFKQFQTVILNPRWKRLVGFAHIKPNGKLNVLTNKTFSEHD